MNLLTFFREHYKPTRLLGKSQRTVVLYEYSIRLFGESLGRPATLQDLNDLVVAKHLQRLCDAKRSPASVAKERAQLAAIWNFAARRRFVEFFPELPPIVSPTPIPKAWTEEQLNKLFEACRRRKGKIRGTEIPKCNWWYALHQVMWDTGERIGAILQLKWDDFEHPWLTIRAEYRKGRQRESLIRLHDQTANFLEWKLHRHNEMIFPWPYSGTYVYRKYNQVLRDAGLPTDSRSKFHRMRRSFASHLYAAGGDATSACGHASEKTTRKSYLDPRIINERQPSDRLFRAG